MAKKRRSTSSRNPKSLSLSIDLNALDKLYKKRYQVSLDGGDTKGDIRVFLDGDTKGGGSIRILDGDTKGGGVLPKPGSIQESAGKWKSTKRR
jgi:hypothetical protein